MRVLVADDSSVTREVMQEFLREIAPEVELVAVGNGIEAYREMKQAPFDLLVLDIEMPEMDGKQLLRSMTVRMPVILVTYDPTFALESYDHGQVVDYLVKPVRFERFLQAYDKAERYRAADAPAPSLAPDDGDDQGIFVKEGYHLVRLDLDRVRYIEAMSDYIAFHVEDNRKHLVMMPMKEAISRLPKQFIRVHRSYIVNLRHVAVVEENAVVIGKKRISVSATHKEALMNGLRLF
ncbi:MAG: LytTR family DNA-binding domain-containing protein [Catalinimonas sp.]